MIDKWGACRLVAENKSVRMCWLLLTYREVDLAASHHIIQERVLSHQLQAQKHKDTVWINESLNNKFFFLAL